ncbi:8025_t:CDS:10 [Paraglomus brasilianum]|uniref:8025_t:CDS:1 n=1 Tax=Paraglomus brasilianum TaxID=144538 RepID=A0A9N9CRE1_9GLOM|nr:8025_t:CDS:10 [Paraglomus brasilianum]
MAKNETPPRFTQKRPSQKTAYPAILNDQGADDQHSSGFISAKEDDNNHDELVEVNNIYRTIPNLCQLVELCLDESTTGQSDSLVNKAIIHPEELEKVCNMLVPGSYRSVSDIQFNKLADVDIQLVGCYGNCKIISKLLLQNNVIDKDRYEKFIKGEQTLATGLYLLIIESDMNLQQSQKTTVGVSTKFGFVILWLEKQFYDEKEILTSATNLHRFLTRLTNHQVCLMSEEDLRNFSFSVNTASPNRIIKIKVKTGPQQEKGVSVKNEIEIKVPELAICNGDPSKAFIIESNALQSLAIMQNISESTTLSKTITEKFNSSNDFQKFLKKKLNEEHYALSLSDLRMDELVILIKDGLDKPDFLVTYDNQISKLIKQRDEKINEYKKEVNQWILSALENYNIYFEKKIVGINSSSIKDNPELKKVYAGHAEVCKDMETKILQIDRKEWKALKYEFYNKREQQSNLSQLKWYEINSDRVTSSVTAFIDSKTGVEEIDNISDANFVADLVCTASENITVKLRKEYQQWKDDGNINKELEECWRPHIQNMSKDGNFFKYMEKLNRINKKESEELKKKLESMYSIGKKMFVKKFQKHLSISGLDYSHQYEFHYDIEVLNHSLCELRILELPRSYGRLNASVNYTNTSLLNTYRKILYISASFEIRKICQLDDGKFVLILWDTEKNVYAIFYGTLLELTENFKRNSMPSRFRLMDEPKNSLITVNYSTGLMATYNNDEHVLNIYNIYNVEKNMRPLHSNLVRTSRLSLKRLLWISKSSMLFVKEDGEAYTFDYNDGYLKYFEKFSKDAASVLSSPNPSCIFVLEPKTTNPTGSKIEGGNHSVNTGEGLEGIENKHPAVPVPAKTDESTVQALVYFVNQDKQCEPLQTGIPLPSHSLIHCRLTYLEQIQHLVTLDLAHNVLVLAKINITSDQSQYKYSVDSIRNSPLSVNSTYTNSIVDVKVNNTNQEQKESVSLGDGFEVMLPELAICSEDLSKAFIIESNTLQSLAIMQDTNGSTITLETVDRFNSSCEFQNFWKLMLNGNCHALSVPDLSIYELTLLTKDGLNQLELLEDYEDQMRSLEDQTENSLSEYKKKLTEWAFSILQDNYSMFEKKSRDTSFNSLEDSKELNTFYKRHKELCNKIKSMALEIDNRNWKILKKKFYYLSGLAGNGFDTFLDVLNTQGNSLSSKRIGDINSLIQKVAECFMDQADLEEECDQETKNILEQATKMVEQISDSDFIKCLCNLQNLAAPKTVMKGIIAMFSQEFQNWKIKFGKRLGKCLEKDISLKTNCKNFSEYTRKKECICEEQSKILKAKLESLYSTTTGSQIIITKLQKITTMQQLYHNQSQPTYNTFDCYELHYVTEINKPYLYELKIWEFELNKYDKLEDGITYKQQKVLYINKEKFEIR